MKGFTAALTVLVFIFLALPAFAQDETVPQPPTGLPEGPFTAADPLEPKDGEVIITLRRASWSALAAKFKRQHPTVKPSNHLLARTLAQQLGLRISQPLSKDTFSVKGRRLNVSKIERARKQGLIATAENNFKIYALAAPTEFLYRLGLLWGLNNPGSLFSRGGIDVAAAKAWEVTTGSPDLVVGVIDTGVSLAHPDLAANIWSNPGDTADQADNDNNQYIDDQRGWDFVNNDNNPNDDNFHGTHVAGVIAGALNGRGIIGVAPSVKILPLKVLSAKGEGDLATLVKAVDYAIGLRDRGVNLRVLNASLGGGGDSQALKAVLERANKKGILFVAAAGNSAADNDQVPVYPASYPLPNIISVAALDSMGALASFSNYGSKSVHLAAPGVNIWSSVLYSFYLPFNGTSMAAPFVSGVAALVFSQHPEYTPAQCRDKILNSARPLDGLKGKLLMPGLVNAAAAVS